jgi:hypothetical protein
MQWEIRITHIRWRLPFESFVCNRINTNDGIKPGSEIRTREAVQIFGKGVQNSTADRCYRVIYRSFRVKKKGFFTGFFVIDFFLLKLLE